MPKEVNENVVQLDTSTRASPIPSIDFVEQSTSGPLSFFFDTSKINRSAKSLLDTLATTGTTMKPSRIKSNRTRQSPIKSKVVKQRALKQTLPSSEDQQYDRDNAPVNNRAGKRPSRAANGDDEVHFAPIPEASAPIQHIGRTVVTQSAPQVVTVASIPGEIPRPAFSFSVDASQFAPFPSNVLSRPPNTNIASEVGAPDVLAPVTTTSATQPALPPVTAENELPLQSDHKYDQAEMDRLADEAFGDLDAEEAAAAAATNSGEDGLPPDTVMSDLVSDDVDSDDDPNDDLDAIDAELYDGLF